MSWRAVLAVGVVLSFPALLRANGVPASDPATNTVVANETKLTVSDSGEFDVFGYRVAIDGDTAVVGAPLAEGGGAAYVFVRSGDA